MFIKSIELEGFKSYGTRTLINGFDKSFNAITGLNGSGKSNILDSLCFVLGITNLSQVRASNLQELVYKNGQAGINKATVTVVFDNSDKSASPIGYETCQEFSVTRTVVIGGKNKYLINGSTATNHRIQDLFQSVHLNVNNPHFLIMQGRITKVINMKPLEILSMVAESAGTRMYETKRDNSSLLLTKKEPRVGEIGSLIQETITPSIMKLEAEHKYYVEYMKINRELEHLTKYHTAWQYLKLQETEAKSIEERAQFSEVIKQSENDMAKITEKIKEIDSKINEIEKKIGEETGSKLKDLEFDLKSKQIMESKAINQLKLLKDSLKDQINKKAELEKNLQEDKQTLALNKIEIEKAEKQLEDLHIVVTKTHNEYLQAQRHLEDFLKGVTSNADGEDKSISQQISDAKNLRIQSETEAKQAQMALNHIEEEIKIKRGTIKNEDIAYSKNEKAYQDISNEVKKLEMQLTELGFSEGKFEELVEMKSKLSYEIDNLKEEIDLFYAKFPNLSLDYSDPIKNFNRKKVYGLVCMLFKPKDPNTSLALEIAAGSKLNNIVVEDEVTGKLLLDKGKLKKRYTVIPLNKIIGNPIENKIVQYAENLVGKNNVATALSCITFSKELTPAIEYVFGSVFICPNMEAAKKVAFAQNIKKKCVTYEGEVFDPSGLLSGGSIGHRSNVLTQVFKIIDMNKELKDKENHLLNIKVEIESHQLLKKKYFELKNKCELKEKEAELIKSNLENSDRHRKIQELEMLEKSLETHKKILATCNETAKKAIKEVNNLELKLGNSSSREKIIEDAQKVVDVEKRKYETLLEEFKNDKNEIENLKQQVEELNENMLNNQKLIDDDIQTIESYKNNIEEAETNIKKIKVEISSLTGEIKNQKSALKSHSQETTKLHKEKSSLLQTIETTKLHNQQLNHDIERLKHEIDKVTQQLHHILENNKWIEEEKKYFGVPNSEYDFNAIDIQATKRRIAHLEHSKTKMELRVNQKAHDTLLAVEDEYKETKAKNDIIIKDKTSLNDFMTDLDDKKKKALIDACEQVNKDFDSILSILLPGSRAKLIPADGKSVLEGLEFKICIEGRWKQSLSELSGGQKSLVALSLILSLLLFNPAPLYILDEVDSALDLSHTQNIGKMLKKHFQKSQFIIVSLKEGMFANANVIFKTQFCDGMSVVKRIVGGK